MTDDVDRPTVGLPRAMERLRTEVFTGRDPENLVTARVTGRGMVERITFANTVSGRRPQAVAAAVLTAIAEARRRGVAALVELTWTRDTAPAPQAPAPRDGIIGGLADLDGGDDGYGGKA